VYQSLGQYDKALEEFREASYLVPDDALTYANIITSYVYLNRLKEALATAEKAQAKNFDSADLRLYLYEVGFLQHDAVRLSPQIEWAKSNPGQRSLLLCFGANSAAYSGELKKSRELARQAVASAELAGEKDRAAGAEATAALSEALFGNAEEARQHAKAATAQSRDKMVSIARRWRWQRPESPQSQGKLWKIWPSDSRRTQLCGSVVD
jgi:tetratricopeptide (TPR) repeat protein